MDRDPHNVADDENGDEEREIPGAAIILDGWFNPGIIHPRWFVSTELLSEEEARVAEQDQALKVTSEASEFKVSGYVFRCRRERLRVASTLGATDFDAVKKVVVGTLTHLPHMPVRVASLNRSAHIPVDRDRWTKLTDRLAPPDARNEILPGSAMSSMTMRLGEDETDFLEVTVESSLRVPGGAFVSVIKRLVFPVDEDDRGANRACAAIGEQWTPLQEQAERIIERVRDNA